MKFFAVAVFLCAVLIHNSLQQKVGSPPYLPDEYRSFIGSCAKILRTPARIVAQLEALKGINDRGGDHSAAEMQCLVRCVAIVTNFYDDEGGINWDQVARQMWANERFDEYRQATRACIEQEALTSSGSIEGAVPKGDSSDTVLCRKFYLHYRCAQKSYLEDTL